MAGAGGIDRDVQLGYPSERLHNASALELGADARIRSGSVIYAGSQIGRGLQGGHNIVIREDCVIGDDVSVWSNSVIDYGTTIGDRVKIHSNCYVAQFTRIEADAFFAPGVTIANDLYPGDRRSAEVMMGPLIGRGAQIGVNVTILPFVEIGEGTIVGAGSVVTRDLPPFSVAYGNPARVRADSRELPDIRDRIIDIGGGSERYRLAQEVAGQS